MEGESDSYKVNSDTKSPSKSPTHSRNTPLIQKVRAHFTSYCNHTSIHGFQYFGQKRTVFEICWWIFIFMCIISACGYAITLIYKKWQQSPVIVSLTTRDTPIYEVPFPAVTICPTIRFSKDCMNYQRLLKNRTDSWLATRNISDWSEIQKNSFQYLIPLCRYNAILQGPIDEATVSDDIYEAIRNCSPFVSGDEVEVRFMDAILSFNESFKQFFTEDGLCFSFNMLSNEDIFTNTTTFSKDSNDSGPESSWIPQRGYSMDADLNTFPRRALLSGAANALEIRLKHMKKDIDYKCTGAEQGYKVILHLPTRVPRPALEYNMAPFGKSTTITVSPHMMATSKVVKSYDADKRDCYFENEKFLKFFNIYSKTNCDFECITNYTLKECSCVPFHMPRESSTPICGIGMRVCVHLALEKYNLMKLRSKLKESKTNNLRSMGTLLRTSIVFSGNVTEVNETEIVDNNNRKKRQVYPLLEDEDDDEARCGCLRACNDITYTGRGSSTDYNWKESDDFVVGETKYDYSLITVYLDTNYIFTTERNELYGPTDFLSNFGGLLGLFTGFSILSFMEIIYFCSLRIFGNLRLIGRWYGDKEE